VIYPQTVVMNYSEGVQDVSNTSKVAEGCRDN